jgi:hypothetical protein
MNKTIKRIAVAFQLAGEPGRRKLSGFLRYINEHQLSWQLLFTRNREEFSRELVASFPKRQDRKHRRPMSFHEVMQIGRILQDGIRMHDG